MKQYSQITGLAIIAGSIVLTVGGIAGLADLAFTYPIHAALIAMVTACAAIILYLVMVFSAEPEPPPNRDETWPPADWVPPREAARTTGSHVVGISINNEKE